MPTTILKLDKVSKSFGALQVTRDFDFSVDAGEAVGIIGPNGAGKTTLFNLISGDIACDSGQVSFKGELVNQRNAAQRCLMGIARSYQVPHPFAGMTLFENLLVASEFGHDETEAEAVDSCVGILEITGLLPKANLKAGSLTLLERKRLELARALATGPDLLLLDEIAGGLTDYECHDLVETINRLRERQLSIVWIEHVVHALLAVVDRLTVINFGEKMAEGDPETVFNSPEVQEIYLGIEVDAVA